MKSQVINRNGKISASSLNMSNPIMLLVVKAEFMIEGTNLHNKKRRVKWEKQREKGGLQKRLQKGKTFKKSKPF